MKNLISYPLQRFMAFTKNINELMFSTDGRSLILEIVNIMTNSDNPLHDRVVLRDTVKGSLITMSMKTLMNSKIFGNINLYDIDFDNQEVNFKVFLQIVNVEDRLDENGYLVYPWPAYNAFDELHRRCDYEIGSDEFYRECARSGIKEDNKLAPKKAFTFRVLDNPEV